MRNLDRRHSDALTFARGQRADAACALAFADWTTSQPPENLVALLWRAFAADREPLRLF